MLTIFFKIERRLTLRISHLEYYIMNDEIPHSYLLINNGIIIISWTWGGLGWTSKDLCNERVHFSATVHGVPGPLSGQRPSRWFTPPTSSPSTWYGGPLLTRPGLSSSALFFFFFFLIQAVVGLFVFVTEWDRAGYPDLAWLDVTLARLISVGWIISLRRSAPCLWLCFPYRPFVRIFS